MGIDNSDSDKFKISSGSTVDSGTILTLDRSDASTTFAGDVTVNGGNMTLTDATSARLTLNDTGGTSWAISSAADDLTFGISGVANYLTLNNTSATFAGDAVVTGNAIVSLGLGLAGNTLPSSDGVSFGTPANVVIRTSTGSGNVIIGDATATSGFSLDVRGTANTGALTASGLAFPTSDGTSGQVIKTDGAGNLSFTDVSTDVDPATSLASDTDCGALSGATADTKDAFGIAVDDAVAELDLRTQGANKLGTVDMGALS